MKKNTTIKTIESNLLDIILAFLFIACIASFFISKSECIKQVKKTEYEITN